VRTALAVLLLVLAGWARPSAAEEGAALATERMAAAEAALDALDPEGALALFVAAARAQPGGRLAARAEERARWIEARREGGYAPLRALLRMRGAEPLADPDREAARLVAFATELASFPPGLVRREGLELVASAYLTRLGRADEALGAFDALLAEPGLSQAERMLALSSRSLALALGGRGERARGALRDAGLEHRPEARHLALLALAARARAVAWMLCALFLAVAVACGGWRGGASLAALGRAWSARRLFAGAYVFLPPLALAAEYESTLARPFAWLVVAALAGWLVALVAAEGLTRSGASTARRRLCAALGFGAILGASWLGFDRGGLFLLVLPEWF
jgi:hypothetical protein